MPGMTARPESRFMNAQIRRAVGGLLLGFVASAPAFAASAKAQASVTIAEAVHVNGLIGVPVTNADLIAAWRAAPATNTGMMPLRLPSLLMPAQAAAGPAFDPAAAATLAQAGTDVDRADDGVLQPGLVAAISAIRYESGEGHAAQLSITVAFN